MADSTILMVGTRKGHVDRAVRRGPRGVVASTGRTSTWRRSTPASSTPAVTNHGSSAGASSSWLGPQVWRSDDLGETWEETPNGAITLPRGHRRHRGPRLAAGRRAPRTVSSTPAPSPAPSGGPTDRGETFALEQALWDHPQREQWGAGFGGQAFHTILPHPTDPDSVTAAISTGGVYQTTDGGADLAGPQPGHPGGVPARGRAVPGVRPVRAQGDPPPGPPGAALPPEPRRRLPLRRRGRRLEVHRRRAAGRLRLPDRRPPPRARHRLRLPARRRRRSLPARRQGPGLALARRGGDLGGARQGAA